ncbi:MAG: glycoside hydrolase family 57 protein [Rikenellaceae bacterium]|nr:glycoside hydrolase family 57 protein [Rikenellaceae bacterium]
MKTVCLNFKVSLPMTMKRYRFFSMGLDHNYLDDTVNRYATQRAARMCYLPMNALIASLIGEYGDKFKVSFTIDGLTIEQLKAHAPEVLASMKELAKTGQVDFLGTTYANSLASLADKSEFEKQVKAHKKAIEKEFGVSPKVFCNSELIYSDGIGEMTGEMGYDVILTEGARHILGWKSPNYVYAGAVNQRQKVMLRNYKLSDDLSFKFSCKEWCEWPLTADKYAEWIEGSTGETVNICVDYSTFGMSNEAPSGIFDFVKALPEAVINRGMEFDTLAGSASKHQAIGVLSCPYPISWTDEERDVTAWLGNELQNEAFSKLYGLKAKVAKVNNPDFNYVWNFMQQTSNFYYMASRWLGSSQGCTPFDSSYDAFINYMNILSDFDLELDAQLAAKKPASRAKKAAAEKVEK